MSILSTSIASTKQIISQPPQHIYRQAYRYRFFDLIDAYMIGGNFAFIIALLMAISLTKVPMIIE